MSRSTVENAGRPPFLKRLARGFGGFFSLGAAALGVQVYTNSGDQPLPERVSDSLRIATYNVHYIVVQQENGPWSRSGWDARKSSLSSAVQHVDADLIAFQEMESFARGVVAQENLALNWLLQNNPDYAAAAVGDPEVFPSTQPIFYRTDRLEVLDEGWFFFSETPDVIYSRTFNGSYPAFASWAQFQDRTTGAVMRVINIHTDFSSRSNRLRSLDLVAERIAPWQKAGESLLVMGDMNARIGDKSLRILQEAGVQFTPVKGATYHFNRGLNLFGAIDHVGVIGALRFDGTPAVVRRRFEGRWPTDHYPVVVDVLHGDAG
ncbi:endonuclease/exonuclease/phosphatase family protein [Antarctobacter jejuensis]|uniref:endonuclease/exonuclease/phosphatase family protein n=1 Tax=Antarctobacter jejuensis TaxID=1439938 RepID=UPI003FD477F4